MPLGMDVGLSPGDFMLDGDPVFPPQQRGWSPTPNFRPISIVPKRLEASRCKRPLHIVRYRDMKCHDISISSLGYDMITRVLMG